MSAISYDRKTIGVAAVRIIKLRTIQIVIIIFCATANKTNRCKSVQDILTQRLSEFIK